MGFLEKNQHQEILNMNDLEMIAAAAAASSSSTSKSSNFDNVGRTVKTALLKAQSDSRVIIGLSAAIKVLSNAPDSSLICLMAEPQIGDSATHMHEVLLEAFCYENDIYVIKVDSAKKLSRILGKKSIETCCLIQKTWIDNNNNNDNESMFDEQLTKSENILVDHCEAYWDSSEQPVIKLPAM